MNTKCIRKISVHIFHNEIEFKLVISALELNENNVEFENNKYILRILMTSFNPVELTTKLGGPWEGYFLWNIINKKVSSAEYNLSILDFLDIFQHYGDDTFTVDNKNNQVFKLLSYNEKTKQDQLNKLNLNINKESNKEKDYFLNVYLKDIDSEFSFHLKSLSGRENICSTDLSIVKCLSEMLNLIKTESDNLHENLKYLSEYNNSQNTNKIGGKTSNSLNATFQNKNEYICSPAIKTDENFVYDDSCINSNNSNFNKNSPNTGGTLNLSELKILTEINGAVENSSNLSLDHPHCITTTGKDVEMQSNYKNEKLTLVNKTITYDLANNNESYGKNCICNKGSLNKISEQIKTYRIIKDLSSRYPINFLENEKNSKPLSNNHFSGEISSNLRSTIDAMRKKKNQSFSKHRHELNEYYDGYNNGHVSSNDELLRNKYYEFYSKNKKDSSIYSYGNDNFNNIKQTESTSIPNRILSKDQLISKLSETSDIGERINILKKIIKNTKKDTTM
ncbi:hypothetical protein RS030_3449 [Cryptosporidium xiaoi]|uniref:Uncharacterized protein n=1 Tax=Cryptosporidium xiaoi TaxID=659607 RepID=A0AAV9XV20_9CRYT